MSLETDLANRTEVRIYRLSGLCALFTIAAFIVPRFVSNPEGGFASGSSAIITLLILLAVTLLFSFYLLTVTIQEYRNLSMTAKFVGIGPSLVLAVALFGLFGFLSF